MKRKFKGLIVAFALCLSSAIAVFASGCGVIDKVKDKIEQSKCEHVFDEGVVAVESTCKDEGKKVFTCTLGCGKTKTEKLELAEHTIEVIPGVEATCTTNGVTAKEYCVVCDYVKVEPQVIAAKGHKVVVDKAIAATCTTEGKTKGEHCSTCNEVLKKQETVAALNHNIVVVKGYAATCTSLGLSDGQKCSRCNEVFVEQEKIAVTGHDYNEGVVTKSATCVETGTIVYTCQTCYATNSVPIPATGEHNVVTVEGYAATCVKDGLTSGQKCSMCDKIYVAQETISAIGHSYDEGVVMVEPTCVSEGVKTYTCAVCADTKTETLAIIDHVAGEDGFCTFCSKVIDFELVLAGSEETDVVVGESVAGNWYRLYVPTSTTGVLTVIHLSNGWKIGNFSNMLCQENTVIRVNDNSSGTGFNSAYNLEDVFFGDGYIDFYIPLDKSISYTYPISATDSVTKTMTFDETIVISELDLGEDFSIKRLVLKNA